MTARDALAALVAAVDDPTHATDNEPPCYGPVRSYDGAREARLRAALEQARAALAAPPPNYLAGYDGKRRMWRLTEAGWRALGFGDLDLRGVGVTSAKGEPVPAPEPAAGGSLADRVELMASEIKWRTEAIEQRERAERAERELAAAEGSAARRTAEREEARAERDALRARLRELGVES